MNDRPDFTAYAVGLVCASVCTSLPDEEATAHLNREYPTGVTPWHVSDDNTFATGNPMPCPCPDSSVHRHLLFNC